LPFAGFTLGFSLVSDSELIFAECIGADIPGSGMLIDSG